MSTNAPQPAPPEQFDGAGWVGIMSQWVAWKVLHLQRFLAAEGNPCWLWRRGSRPPPGLKAIAGIGYKRSSAQARVLCERWKLPYIALEDGFLRSSSLGVEGDTPMSMVIDPIGIHYLADRPSQLENLLQVPEQLSAADLETARQLIELMTRSGIGKYNHAPDLPASDSLGRERALVLVVDQTYGDFSIPGGGLHERDFIRMLDAALEENPGADVRVRIHPDCVAGHKKSCLLDAARQRGVTLESRAVSWSSLARRASRVYVGTSQAGLEALILGVAVTCFGLPFYAGWGLTDDRMAIPRRTGTPSLLQLVAAAYVRYCRYVNPLTGQLTDVLTVARQLALQKSRDSDFAGPITVLGVKVHKQHNVRRLLSSRWGTLTFAKHSPDLLRKMAAEQATLVVWAAREPAGLSAEALANKVPLWRIEDAFLRSTGLGVHNAPAVSLILDRGGMHYERNGMGDLEYLLEHAEFDAQTLQEAARLRERINAGGITKYNLLGRAVEVKNAVGQRCILVPGQVEEDASLQGCSPSLRSNLQLLQKVRSRAPDAWILYKPHPDVEAGKRADSLSPARALEYADQFCAHADINALYAQVDEVHTLSSTAGFEALLRGLHVTTYGMPFYAGRGLTSDYLKFTQRTRRVSLDHLVAAALVRYPLYNDLRHNLPCDAWHALTLLQAGLASSRVWPAQVRALGNYGRLMLGLSCPANEGRVNGR